MPDATTSMQAQLGPERDDDAGGPAHPAPGFTPPAGPGPEPEHDQDEHEDDAGGPAHPAPGHMPPDHG